MLDWFAVCRYKLDGTAQKATVVKELEDDGCDVIDAADGFVMATLGRPFLSTAKNMCELRGDALRALPRPAGCRLPEVINVTRAVDNWVHEF